MGGGQQLSISTNITIKNLEQEGQHYLLIDSYESKNAITLENNLSSIALYIPPNSLQTSHGANYEGLDNVHYWCIMEKKPENF